MKSVLLTVCLLTSMNAEARDFYVPIPADAASAAQLNGFTEVLYGKPIKSCFSGASNLVCQEVKSSVKRLNHDLSQAGTAQRFQVLACAQNPARTMVIFALRTAHDSAQKAVQKTVFIDRCAESES